MTLKESLKPYILAAFSGLWVQTHEPDEAQREIARLCNDEGWCCQHWNMGQGEVSSGAAAGDPLAALDLLTARPNETSVLTLRHYHRFLNNPMAVERLFNKVIDGKADRLFVVVLSPTLQIPLELEKLFVVVEHQLPAEADLFLIAQEVVGEEENAAVIERPVVAAAAGLTRWEAEGAFALSLARSNAITPESVWELKASTLKKSGLLELHRGKERFADLGGLDALKTFCCKALAHAGAVKSKGVLLLGVPGTGKSAFAKALGAETGRPTLTLDVGSLYGPLVGQTEERIRQALKIADAMAPCVLFVDEIEKALSGVGSNGDSGVSTRLFGTLLTWLSDHTTDVFVVATCNDVSKLPPEFSRAERWDAIYFLDLPNESQRHDIWDLYGRLFHIQDATWADVDDAQWTGAEIRACCRLSALLEIPLAEAAEHVVPVARTAADRVQALREWAAGRCLDASRGGVYSHKPVPINHAAKRRAVARNKE